jgi:competence protein ComEC
MLAYLGLSGASIPAVRAFIMISLFLLGLVIGRKGFWLNSLLFAAFILVVWEPDVIFSLSFQLSFLAVIFIGFSIQKEEKGEIKEKVFFHKIRNVVLISLSASPHWWHTTSTIFPSYLPYQICSLLH